MLHKSLAAAVLLSLGAVACSDDPTATVGQTTLLSVTPAGGTADVALTATVDVEFSHAMHVEIFAALHREDATGRFGPLVDGMWSWSADQTHLMFTPDWPLMPGTDYTIHVGGGMIDADGNVIDMGQRGPGMGGQWMTHQMMQGCMMQVCGSMMGDGWMHPDNGSFGMGFTFTTVQ